jgi:citrate synthase
MPTYLSAEEAASALGISLPTLYAYVSRGLVRSEGDAATRKRRYLAEDIWLLNERKQGRRDPQHAARNALHWGMPVLESRLSLIHDGRLYYAGHDAVELAGKHAIEAVASLLWRGELGPLAAEPVGIGATEWRAAARLAERLPPLEGLQLWLPVLAAHDPLAYDLRPESVRRVGARILRALAAAAVGALPSDEPVARVLQRRWQPREASVARLLDAAMVLYADNGLNPSSFSARCVASAGSTPYAVVAAGLAALQGVKHGGACERAAGLLDEVRDARSAREAVGARLRRGETLPGFGHPQYGDGDPRAAYLLDRIAAERPKSPEVARARAVVEAARDALGERPSIDFAVVALCRTLTLPPVAPLLLLGVARVVGWIGHGLEQYQEGRTIRPRARYAGARPG